MITAEEQSERADHETAEQQLVAGDAVQERDLGEVRHLEVGFAARRVLRERAKRRQWRAMMASSIAGQRERMRLSDWCIMLISESLQ